MYEVKRFDETDSLLAYLNGLSNAEIIYVDNQNDRFWTVLVKRPRMGRPPKKDVFTKVDVLKDSFTPDELPPDGFGWSKDEA